MIYIQFKCHIVLFLLTTKQTNIFNFFFCFLIYCLFYLVLVLLEKNIYSKNTIRQFKNQIWPFNKAREDNYCDNHLLWLWRTLVLPFNSALQESPFLSVLFDGVDGSRTRVQKPIPCPSTIIVRYLGRAFPGLFPPEAGNEQPAPFGSFILRPCAQSLTHVVSHMVDARIPRCECPGADKLPKAASFTAITLQMLTEYYLQRLV